MPEQALLHCLPLLATALGRRHGLTVSLDGADPAAIWPGGDDTLHLPPLPVEADAAGLRLLRGHIDMEAARIRYSDRQELVRARMDPATCEICRILETWRTSSRLAGRYPGCGRNIRELVRNFGEDMRRRGMVGDDPARCLLPYIEILIWSADVPDLREVCREMRADLVRVAADLPDRLEAVVMRFRQEGAHSRHAVQTARELARLLHDVLPDLAADEVSRARDGGEAEEDAGGQAGQGEDAETCPDNGAACAADEASSGESATEGAAPASEKAEKNLAEALSLTEAFSLEDALDLGDAAGDSLSGWLQERLWALPPCQAEEAVIMAREAARPVYPLDGAARLAALQASAALRARLRGLLQAHVLRRTLPARRGRLDSRSLWRLGTGDTRIFCRHDTRRELDTAVHILLDASTSMEEGDKMMLACQACFALMYALQGLSGITTAITVFPGGDDVVPAWEAFPLPAAGARWSQPLSVGMTVAPVVRFGQRLHTGFTCMPDGGTPLGAALWWALAQLQPLSQRRKLLIVLSDGEAQDEASCRQAIRLAPAQGVEILGIGLQSAAIGDLLPHHSVIIQEMRELPDALFRLLQDALLRAHQRLP
ncbi:hypothetical protein [uncultured Desulfovibrio sp.]|uniref:hypothetical protein n=1 Tax=uncultured Desulfovibrio sp. TaxID=167968 RepID=UPI0026113F66|nr:hypothetical protein [uncultured Desulfovibrio sp.]